VNLLKKHEFIHKMPESQNFSVLQSQINQKV